MTTTLFLLGFLSNIGGTQLFIIILFVLLLFGSKRLPEVAKSLGKAMREFKKSASQVEDEFKEALEGKDEEKRGEGMGMKVDGVKKEEELVKKG